MPPWRRTTTRRWCRRGPTKPRDKAKAEVAVQVAQRWIVARLRNRRFFSRAELNAAVRDLVVALNDRVTRHLGASRRQLFADLERPALKPLPAMPVEYAQWQERTVGLDYTSRSTAITTRCPTGSCVRRSGRATEKTVEIFHDGQRVAAHLRTRPDRRHTTLRDHMPSSHRRYADWTPERIRREAAAIGPAAEALVAAILSERTHPEQGFRSCLGILRLARAHDPDRLEAACRREIGARSYTSVNSILKTRLDRRRPEPAADGPAISHPNIRGGDYFH
jgi:transposase